jgi:tetratricopeptide (TPR) repeat protein
MPENQAVDLARAEQCVAGNQWEEALAVYEEIQSRMPERGPAEIQAYLKYLQGNCYGRLADLKNSKANLTKTIEALQTAFSFYNDKNRLLEPAIIQNQLGVTYRSLAEYPETSQADLTSQAGNAFLTAQKLLEKALKSFTPNQNPVEYLRANQNMGNTGNALAESGDAELNYDRVVNCSQAALKMMSDGHISPEAHPLVHGVTQYNLGYALNALAVIRNQKELRDQASAAYREALRQYPVNDYPVEHTHILNQLAGISIDLAEESGLEDHLNEAIKISKNILEVLTSKIKYPLGYGLILYNLGRACQLYGRIRNRKDEYLSKARQYLESVLEIPDLPPLSKILAATHLDLGKIYLDTASHAHPELYLPKAVHSFTETIHIYNDRQSPVQYAIAQSNLADAYYMLAKVDNGSLSEPEQIENMKLAQAALAETVRILSSDKGSVAFRQNQYRLANISLELANLNRQKEPLQKAIQSFKDLLELIDVNSNPFDYAQYQTGLGDSYALGAGLEDDPASLSHAIETYEAVLKVYTPDLFPLEHAKIITKIGGAYREFARVQNKEGNLTKAISHFQNAVKYCPSDKYPLDSASIYQKLGNTLLEMAEISPKNHYSMAAQALESAVKVFTFENDPENHAEIQITLGHCYLNIYRIGGADLHLSKARNAFEAALKYFSFEHFPYHFASIMNDIGITLDMMAKGVKAIEFQNQTSYQKYVADRIANTIGAYEAALSVFTFADYPEDYAQVQFNLGLTYSFWAGIQNKSENAAKAIHAFEEALKIYTPEKHPTLYRQVNTQLEKEKQKIS